MAWTKRNVKTATTTAAATTPVVLLMAILLTSTAVTTAAHGDTKVLQRLVGGYLRLETAEAGGGKTGSDTAAGDSDERKTLSQQVADGKYGLIQRELFSADRPPEAPGVISYGKNPEVPRDNDNTLGGLAREEIWLAEDHLLVLRGGQFEAGDSPAVPVSPIDDYKAPNRQVKIPSRPKVPPPFPVQLQEGGPIRILEAAPPGTGAETPTKTHTTGANKTNFTTGKTAQYLPSQPSAPPQENFFRGNGPRLGPFPIDEDDPSIYYPPPYSFFYPKDNSTEVPPGPLVPGIVLPPPPNFFGPLSAPSTTTSTPTPPTTARSTTTTTTAAPVVPLKVSIRIRPSTTPAPIPATQAPRPVYYEYFERKKPIQELAPPRTYISSTAVPLKAFFTTQSPAQFYFYEEEKDEDNEVNTNQPQQLYYTTVQRRPPNNINNFERHIERLRQQIQIQQQQQQLQRQLQMQRQKQLQLQHQQLQFQEQRKMQQQQIQRHRQPRPVYQYSFGYDDPDSQLNQPLPTAAPPPAYNVQIQPSANYGIARPRAVTPNPHLAFYTKQETGIFDDITKKYFTTFGKKITTPLPPPALLHRDTIVNYRQPRPLVNPHAEYINSGEGKPGTFISYRLPGDGAHFYFLTPQLAQQANQHQRSDPVDTGYYYPAPPRLTK